MDEPKKRDRVLERKKELEKELENYPIKKSNPMGLFVYCGITFVLKFAFFIYSIVKDYQDGGIWFFVIFLAMFALFFTFIVLIIGLNLKTADSSKRIELQTELNFINKLLFERMIKEKKQAEENEKALANEDSIFDKQNNSINENVYNNNNNTDSKL